MKLPLPAALETTLSILLHMQLQPCQGFTSFICLHHFILYSKVCLALTTSHQICHPNMPPNKYPWLSFSKLHFPMKYGWIYCVSILKRHESWWQLYWREVLNLMCRQNTYCAHKYIMTVLWTIVLDTMWMKYNWALHQHKCDYGGDEMWLWWWWPPKKRHSKVTFSYY